MDEKLAGERVVHASTFELEDRDSWKTADDVTLAEGIAREVARHGGRVYYVGGLVRDRLLGRENKDVDIEVHGIDATELTHLLAAFGEVNTIGASFGILSLRGHTLDIALPRKDGVDHGEQGDLAALTDPFLGTFEAARRRDLTINALYEDVLTGEVIDHFGGCADLERGVIRYVDATTFVADPLRVLRVAQFAARFGMEVDEATTELCAGLDLSQLPSERVLEEVKKALLKAPRPSVFWEELRKMRQLDTWFGEVGALVGVPQNPEFHPEGDVWTHTMCVLDCAADMREQASDGFAFLMASLCHDLGKATTTCELDGRLVSYGHETEGVPLAAALLDRLGVSGKVRSYVLNMVELHMAPNAFVAQKAKQKSYNKLFDRSCCPRDLLMLSRADEMGCGNRTRNEQVESELHARLEKFEEIMARPYVQGRDLLELGVEPGPLMGETLVFAHKLRLVGMDKQDMLRQCLGYWGRLVKDREGKERSKPRSERS